MASNRRMRLVCKTGKTFLRMIFSMIIGTAMTSAGLTSVKALAMSVGDGRRLRKKMWHPLQKAKMNSKARPYMWAMGRKLSIDWPALTCVPRRLRAKSRLPHSARYGSMTPLENPVVPLV